MCCFEQRPQQYAQLLQSFATPARLEGPCLETWVSLSLLQLMEKSTTASAKQPLACQQIGQCSPSLLPSHPSFLSLSFPPFLPHPCPFPPSFNLPFKAIKLSACCEEIVTWKTYPVILTCDCRHCMSLMSSL